ncbi:MAG: hypothetical protein OEZ65_02915 [Gemmatimonadota bacterium]|nr:hypothetical protein [Gemmatimonadota bacterium]MDH5758515.1 hypothetical protein [Gemmatimonadota bacterium]
MEQLVRTRLITAVLIVTVFSAGFLLGVLADGSLLAGPADVSLAADSAAGSSPERKPMYAQVDPDSAQLVRIDSIVRVHRRSMKALHEEFRGEYALRYDALVHDTRSAIKAVLTPAQAARYDTLTAQRDRERAEKARDRDRDDD